MVTFYRGVWRPYRNLELRVDANVTTNLAAVHMPKGN
jgi:hypothetical protein